jgi:hypothetical protein
MKLLRGFTLLMVGLAVLPLPALAVPGEYGADVRVEAIVWPQTYGEATNNNLTRIDLVPSAVYKPTPKLRFTFKPEIVLDPQNNSPEERTFADLGETALRYKANTFTLQAGSLLFNWGVTDGYNPLDVVNTRQYFDPLHAKKLGAVGIAYAQASEQSEQELVFIPMNRPSILPGTQSRWLPREILAPLYSESDAELILPPNLRFRYVTREQLNEALKNNIAARLQWHWSGIDLGIIGYEGVASFPIVQPTEITGTIVQISPKIIIRADPDVPLRLKDFRQKLVGGSWVSSQWGFLFKYAASYSSSVGDDPQLPGWEHHNVVAVEKNFQPTEAVALTAVLQHSFVNTERPSESNLSVNEIFRRAWMLGGRMTYGDFWTVTAFALYDSIHYSNSQNLTIARKFKDVWTVEVNGTLISGTPDTPLGVYERNDSYSLALSRSF